MIARAIPSPNVFGAKGPHCCNFTSTGRNLRLAPFPFCRDVPRRLIFPRAMTTVMHIMFFLRRPCSSFTISSLAASLLFTASVPSAEARPPNQLVLATSADDPALRTRLAGLSPSVKPEEARHVTYIAYTTGLELARKWEMGSSPTMHSFLINIGVKKGGYCHQFATELLLRLETQRFKTLEFHWAESDAGTDTEHNVIAVTARGQPFEQGIMLDNWRRSGRLLWGPLNGDPDHTWQENKAAYASRIIRKPVPADQTRRETSSKKKTPHRAKSRPKGNQP
jgi:hypothetical protein